METFFYYKNRKTGSQSEQPKLIVEGSKLIVDGYQRFIYDEIAMPLQKDKYGKIFLMLDKLEYGSVSDLGCSAGLVGLMLYDIGFTDIACYDHDLEYITLLNKICLIKNIPIKPFYYWFGDAIPPTDYVMMFALIHWLFGMTADYDNFDKIFSYLKSICKKCLIIEWVDPSDPAIQYLHHIRNNKEEYTEENFIKAIEGFGKVEEVLKINNTRKLYKIWKT